MMAASTSCREMSQEQQQASEPPTTNMRDQEADFNSEELVAIMDETGEGWGFDLDPKTVAKPFALISGGLFAIGLLAGVPAGIALGRSEESSGRKNLKPTAGGMWLATKAFAYGTLLCGAMGAAATYATAYYYDAWTWEEFGTAMRNIVPRKKQKLEQQCSPFLNVLRNGATDSLLGPTSRAKEWLSQTSLGNYIRSRIDESSCAQSVAESSPQAPFEDDIGTSNESK